MNFKRRWCSWCWWCWYLSLWPAWSLLLLMSSTVHHCLAQTDANVSSEYGAINGEFPYFVAGTAYPCSDLEECTYVINGSDPMGGVEMDKEEAQLTPSNPCILQGRLTVAQNWYGYLASVTLAPNEGLFYYRFAFAKERCCIKIILYLEEQASMLRAHMNCLQRQSLVDPTSPQIITLSPSNTPAGCTSVTEAAGLSTIECRSGRWLKSDIPRKWYIAASSCGSPSGLDVEYSLVIYGHTEPCPSEDAVNNSGTRLATCCSLLLTFPSITAGWLIVMSLSSTLLTSSVHLLSR